MADTLVWEAEARKGSWASFSSLCYSGADWQENSDDMEILAGKLIFEKTRQIGINQSQPRSNPRGAGDDLCARPDSPTVHVCLSLSTLGLSIDKRIAFNGRFWSHA